MAGIDFTEDALLRARSVFSKLPLSYPRGQGVHEGLTLCPPDPPVFAPVRTPDRGCQKHSQMDSRTKAARFLAPITFRYRIGTTKRPAWAKLPFLRLKYPIRVVGIQGQSSRDYGAKQATSLTTQGLCSFFYLPFHSLTSYKLLPIKKGSTF